MSENEDREFLDKGAAEEVSTQFASSKLPKAKRSPSFATSSPQEREALLARAAKAKLKRTHSAGYGTKERDDDRALTGSRRSIGSNKSPPVEYSAARSETKETERSAKQKGESTGAAGVDGAAGAAKDGTTLVIAFIVMIFVGTGNRVFMKLQTYPMYNYPFFLTMLTTFVYVPVCFAYIIPMIAFGSAITSEQQAIPKHKFAVMGLLDSVSGIMGVFAVNYISNAAVIVLLQQATIPFSMSISKLFLGAQYSASQYVGASVVIAGIVISLIPTLLRHPKEDDDVDAATQALWSVVQVLACIPMCLSSVYKEKALGDDDIDVIYLNGWVAIFQFMASLLFAVPSAFAMGLPLPELPRNSYQGYQCFLGRDSQQFTAVSAGMHPDDCESAPVLVTLYLFFNLIYNVVLIVILKYGSANVLFLASTVMVPIGNVAFSLEFVPHHQDLRTTDTVALFFILAGLVVYRFSTPLMSLLGVVPKKDAGVFESDESSIKVAKLVGTKQLENLEPLMQTRIWQPVKANLRRSPEQIRASFMHRLGLPPAPSIPATPTARTSPFLARRSSMRDAEMNTTQRGGQVHRGQREGHEGYHSITPLRPSRKLRKGLSLQGDEESQNYE